MEVQGEEGAFKMNMSEEGASKLAAQLTLALKDYLGEFVDDTLVKYVIVLLGNGRSKDEVKEDLDVFLGDSSHSFVTWLWDHLASNVDQYVQSSGFLNEATKVKPELVEHNGKLDSHQPISDSDLGKSVKSSRRRHNRDWKELVTDDTQPPPLRSSVTNLTQCEEKAHRSAVRAKQSMSPDRPLQRKRSRPDERPRPKRDAPQATIAATRRLLQFAVREAVGTTRPSNPLLEPSRKRLRSVVATSTGNSTEEVHPQRIQSVVRLPNTMATAIRAVAEAAEDVRKVRTCNVFDRLSRGVDESSEVVPAFREPAVLDAEYEDYDQIHEKPHQSYLRASDYSGRYNLNASMMDSNTGLASDSASDNEGYDNVNLSRRVMDVSETSTSRGNKANDSLMVQYSVAQDTDEMMRQLRTNDQEKPNSAANTKHKIVNISVNVNTWKPSHYQPGGEMVEVETKKSTQKSGAGDCHPNGKSATEPQKEHQKVALSSIPGPYSTGRPLEDADLRTVFVNNVHFAATKDTLSRHFNKFGDVLKVIILTDAATGHPKGSAYVEFMRKEAAESALSLDGTSFMSRIIKVVKKSSAQQEASPVMTWPRITRGSPFAVPRYAQAPFSRVFPGAYRGRPSIKPGARSMQWKRDGIPTSAESSASVSGSVSTPPAGRGLTYIRPDFKSDTNPGAA